MNKSSHGYKPVAILAVVFSALGGFNTAAIANTTQQSQLTSLQQQQELQLAQLKVGDCRAAKQRIFVYTQRSLNSQTLRTLASNEQVTLADTGSAGWIAISSPVKGYVQARDLKLCANQPNPPSPPPTQASTCRVVTYKGPEGLAVRREPNKTAARVAGLKLGDRVTLRAVPPEYRTDNEGRAWVQITAPVNGWISYGYLPNGGSNIGACS